jgi:hypothetical protein
VFLRSLTKFPYADQRFKIFCMSLHCVFNFKISAPSLFVSDYRTSKGRCSRSTFKQQADAIYWCAMLEWGQLNIIAFPSPGIHSFVTRYTSRNLTSRFQEFKRLIFSRQKKASELQDLCCYVTCLTYVTYLPSITLTFPPHSWALQLNMPVVSKNKRSLWVVWKYFRLVTQLASIPKIMTAMRTVTTAHPGWNQVYMLVHLTTLWQL